MGRILLGCIFLGAMLVAGCSEPANQKNLESGRHTTDSATENRIPGQYIVTLMEGTDVKILHKVFAEFGVESVRDLAKDRFLITLDKDPGPDEIAIRANTSSEIKHIQPNYIYQTTPPLHDKPQRPR